MKTVIAIVVYNRLANLQHWLESWELCDKRDSEVVVIHNHDFEDARYEELCKKHSVLYIRHANIGFDIGRFQDLCRGRLVGFPEDWERVLWLTDDTVMMCKDFVQKFEQAMKTGVGVVCMEISKYVRPHIRTTGFMISKGTASRLTFPADPIITKQHCYLFEHRHIKNTFLAQVERMGLKVQQVAPRETSPMFDTGYHRRLPREAEHAAIFGGQEAAPLPAKDTVTFICPIYKSFPAIISSLIMQTNPNWQLKLIHDGPGNGEAEQYVNLINDDRIEYIETPEHRGLWGHYIRSHYLQLVTTKYVIITNPDNTYQPKFIEKAMAKLKNGAIAAYSQQIVHSYTDWKVMNCRVERGFLDCGQVLMKTKEVQEVGWNNITDHSSDWFFFNDIARKYGKDKFVPFAGCHFTHN